MNPHEWMAQQPSEDDGGPCQAARDWVAARRHLTIDQLDEALADHPQGSEWLWWLARYLGVPLAALARDAALRALRYASAALERAGLHDHAAALRALPDDADLTEAAFLAREAAARAAMWPAAAWAAELAARAAEAGAAEAAEAAEAAARAVAWEAAGAEAAAEEERRLQRESLVLLVLAALTPPADATSAGLACQSTAACVVPTRSRPTS